MTQATTVRGTKLLVLIEATPDSGTFTHNCSMSGPRSLQMSSQTNDVNVPDCDDPELMAWVEREKVSVSVTIQGGGVTHTPNVKFFFNYAASSDPLNVRFLMDVPGADGGGYMAGAFLCTDFNLSGDRGQKADIQVTLQSTGLVSWVDAA